MTVWKPLVVGLAAIVTGCGVFTSYPAYRYRLRVEVETPAGRRIGSSVIEVSCSSSNTGISWASGSKCEVNGEAVTVDLPGGKVLFALLTRPGYSEGANSYAFDAFPSNRNFGGNAAAIDELKAQPGVALLPRQHVATYQGRADSDPPTAYPMLVTFADMKNPKSVIALNPDNLAATFGSGYRLGRITVQMTDEPITKGIFKRLQWLRDLHGGYLGGEFTSLNSPYGLDATSFSSEVN